MVTSNEPTDRQVDEQVKTLIDRILSADNAKPTHSSAIGAPTGAQALDDGDRTILFMMVTNSI